MYRHINITIFALLLAVSAHAAPKPPAIAVGAEMAPYIEDDCSYTQGWIDAYRICVERLPGADPDRVAPYSWTVGEECQISDVSCYTVSCGEASRPEGLTTENGTIVYPPGTAENPQPLKEELADEVGRKLLQGKEDAKAWREGWTNWLWESIFGSETDGEEESGGNEEDGEEENNDGDGFLPGDGGCFPLPF